MTHPSELKWTPTPPSLPAAAGGAATMPTASRWSKIVAFAALVAGGLPLLVYPAVLLAGIMSLAGHRTGEESSLLVVISSTALLSSLLYPMVYVPCLLLAISRLRHGGSPSLPSLAPLVYLAAVAAMLLWWFSLDAS